MSDEPKATDDDVITCWCGAKGTYDELFDDSVFDQGCGGTKYLDCHCGGDLCVCHHHGREIECPGCEDCGGDDEGWGDDYDCWREPEDA